MPNVDILSPMTRKLARRSPLGERERAALQALPHRIADLDRSRFIAREGEPNRHCCLLLSGFAYCHRLTGDGARQILSVHLTGDLLDLQNGAAEIATSNVQPLSPVRVAFIPRAALLALADAHPSIAAALWADTGANASILAEWLLNVGRRNARARIAHLMCELAVRQQTAGLCNGPHYPWWITQEQLGDATGLTSVHVNRTLQGLRQEGLLQTVQRQVSLLDWPGLCAAGDFSAGYLQFSDVEEAALADCACA